MSTAMLDYLCFDESDDGLGITTLDALASVLEQHLPALEVEVQQVLRWMREHWGEPSAETDDGDQSASWSYAVHVQPENVPNQPCRYLLSFTIAAPTAWCDQLLAHFVDYPS